MKIKRKTIKKIKRWFFIVLGISVCFGILYIIFGTTFIRINSFDLVGVDERYKTQITTSLNESLKNKFLLIPTNNLLTYRSAPIRNIIKYVLTNTKSVSVYPISLHTIRVKVEKYNPTFRLDNDSNAIDSSGVAYKELDDTSNLPILFASTTLNTETIIKITTIIPKIETVLFKVDKVVVDEYDDVHLINDNSKSDIILKSKDDANSLWLTLLSAIDTDPLKNNLTLKKDSLQYIDLRFGNKVFYKFQPEAGQLPADTTQAGKMLIYTQNATTSTSTRVLAEPYRQ